MDDVERQLSLWAEGLPEAAKGITLEEAQRGLFAQLKEGASCPCCGQYARIYRRKLDATMARGLCWLVRESGPGRAWVHVGRTGPRWLVGQGGTFALLAHWGMIEARPAEPGSLFGRCSGQWRPTERGERWSSREIEAPSHVFLFDNHVVGWADTHIGVQQALGRRFDYEEVMGRR